MNKVTYAVDAAILKQGIRDGLRPFIKQLREQEVQLKLYAERIKQLEAELALLRPRPPPYCCAEYPECAHWTRPVIKRKPPAPCA